MKWCSENGLPHSELLNWDPSDRSKLVAYLLEAQQRCQVCGSSSWEWEEDKWAYQAAVHTCPGCKLVDAMREDYEPGPGARITLVPSRRRR